MNKQDAKQMLKNQQEDILKQIDAFIQRGSNWQIDKILAFYINISKYKRPKNIILGLKIFQGSFMP